MAEFDRKLLDGNLRSLAEQLKVKSRRRREGLAHMAAAYPLRNDVLPSLEIVYLPLDQLPPAKRKLRQISLQNTCVRLRTRSAPSALRAGPHWQGQRQCIDGDLRVEAARRLGLGRVPCMRIEHLSEIEQRVLPPRGQSPWGEGRVEPGRAQDRIRGADPRRCADRDLRLHSRRDRPDRSRPGSRSNRGGACRAGGRRHSCRPHRRCFPNSGAHQIICGDATDPERLAPADGGRPAGAAGP